jgi:hypothetical protein
MARLTSSQWLSLRAQWETSPNSGLAWLTCAGGGPWPVSTEAIRKRRLAEGWAKLPITLNSVHAVHQAAHHPAAEHPTGGAGGEVGCWHEIPRRGAPPTSSEHPTSAIPDNVEQSEADVRDKLLKRHREEWRLARKLVYDAAQEAVRASGLEKARFAKILAETLRIVQRAEREVYGLDAELIPWDSLSIEQLKALAAGKWPR